MNDKKKKQLFALLIIISSIILIVIGSTFAYFSASVMSEEGAVGLGSAVYRLEMKEDTSLLKTQLIPSAEKYVDLSIDRLDETGEFLKPYEVDGETIKKNTVCIDDNLNEICSVYTFTVLNPMTDIELPLYITLNPVINTFENIYFKVVQIQHTEEDGYQLIELTEAKPIPGAYTEDENGNSVYDATIELHPVELGIEYTIKKAVDKDTPTSATFSIVMWIMETGTDQTKRDSGQVFGATLYVSASGSDGNGITGVFSAGGVE